MRTKEPTGTRFVRFEREGWLVMQANVDLPDLARCTNRQSPYELEVSTVPNSVAANAPALLEALELIAAFDCMCEPAEPLAGLPGFDCPGCLARATLAAANIPEAPE